MTSHFMDLSTPLPTIKDFVHASLAELQAPAHVVSELAHALVAFVSREPAPVSWVGRGARAHEADRDGVLGLESFHGFLAARIGRLAPELGACELPVLMTRAVSTCELVGGLFELDLFGNLPPVLADPELATSALGCLIAHSGRATSWSTPVCVQAYSVPHAVELCISAEGPRATPQEIHALQEAASDEHPRSRARVAALFGLGVELARELLTLHGSRLELVDRSGSGRTFRFRLTAAYGVGTGH